MKKDPLSLKEKRERARQKLKEQLFDLVIVGGGINGAAIAREAALRGYSVVLFEQNDFGFGTSGRSSRLIHGGLRYLEHGQIRMVFESVSERSILANTARHLVRPLPFVFPAYTGMRRLVTLELGLWIYDALALFRNYRNHMDLSQGKVCEYIPGINTEKLRGGVLYYDYQTNDARLVLENVLSALSSGAHALSYARVEALERSQNHPHQIHIKDLIEQDCFTVKGRVVICAAGPWTDRFLRLAGEKRELLRPTKGVHLLFPWKLLPIHAALVMQHPRDKRILFAIPWHERTIVGTTDTHFNGDPGAVQTNKEDVYYLIDAVQHYFPGQRIKPSDVLLAWAGIRPLVRDESDNDPSAISREHRIESSADGIAIIVGGKLTTYRKMAAECMEVAMRAVERRGGPKRLHGIPTSRLTLPGAKGIPSDSALDDFIEELLSTAKLSRDQAQHLARTYGGRASALLDLMKEDGTLAEPIIEGLPYIWAEILWSIREEMALTLADLMMRRTQLFYRAEDQGMAAAAKAGAMAARELGWSSEEEGLRLEEYRALIASSRSWQDGSQEE